MISAGVLQSAPIVAWRQVLLRLHFTLLLTTVHVFPDHPTRTKNRTSLLPLPHLFSSYPTMAPSHLTDPQTLESQVLDVHSIKPWPMRPKPPTTARSQAWRSSINLVCNTFGLHEEQARQQYNSTPTHYKWLYVQPAEPASSYTLAHLVTEVCKLQGWPQSKACNRPLTEGDLLNLLFLATNKPKCGIQQPYRPGTEGEDAKLISAAVHYFKWRQREKARACTISRQSDRFLAATLHASRKYNLLSKPSTPHQPIVATPGPTKKRKFESSSGHKNQLPHPIKQTRSTLDPSANSTHTLHSSPPQPRLKPKSATVDFGNRIEQAMLKIEKWADSWLSGAMPQTDLAWDSFEFCLCMPDILEEGQVMER